MNLKPPSATQAKDAMAKAVSRLHSELYRRSGGKVGGRFRQADTLLLTHTGRRSGQPRTAPLLFIRDGDRFVIVASYGGDDRDPQWFKNLQANPEATVLVATDTVRVTAAVASPEEKQRFWPRLVAAYGGYESYQRKTSRDIPVVILTPQPG